MKNQGSPPVRTFLPISLILAVPGWLLLIYLVTQTVPELKNRWLFFAAIVITITGSAFPVVAYLNRIIKPFGPANYETVVREAIMTGLYSAILLWLNKGQVLSFGLALILAVGLILVELLIRLRNRSAWHPDEQ
jgi:uncharacterized membrane protein YjjB (DUF3815 family)